MGGRAWEARNGTSLPEGTTPTHGHENGAHLDKMSPVVRTIPYCPTRPRAAPASSSALSLSS